MKSKIYVAGIILFVTRTTWNKLSSETQTSFLGESFHTRILVVFILETK